MDFAALKKRVREMNSLTLDDDAQVGLFVNEALLDFARDAGTNPVAFTFNTVVGQSQYALSGAAVTPNGVIRFLPDEEDPSITHTYDFVVRGLSTLVVSPTPWVIGAVTGWVVPRPATLVNAADTPAIPVEYRRAIVYRACQLTAEWDAQDMQMVQMWEAKYEAEVMKALKQRKRGRRPSALRPSTSPNPASTGLMRGP